MGISIINISDDKGFTLIELMIVICIIGILAAIAVPEFLRYRQRAHNSAALSDVRNMKSELEGYYAEYLHYPNSI